MRIQLLAMHYKPETAAIFNVELCEHLIAVNHDVTVFTAFPHYPQWEIHKGYKNKIFKNENLNGVKVKRSYVYVPKKVTPINRVKYEASFILSSFIRILFAKNPDCIIVISTPLGLGITAYLISRLKNAPFIFHIKDIQPDTAIDLKMINNGFLIKLLYRVEKFIYRKASFVSSISTGMVNKIISKGINKKKVIIFRDWVDITKYTPGNKINDFSIKNNLTNKFVVSYCGNFGIKQGLELVLQVAADMSIFTEIIFLLIGDGVAKNKLLKIAEKLKLKNIQFLGPQSENNYVNALSSSDICLIIQKSQLKDVLVPSKLLHITGSGRPVISTAVEGSEAYSQIKIANCGISIKPENSFELKKAILKLKDNKPLREELGRNGRLYAEKHFEKNKILYSFSNKLSCGAHLKPLKFL